MASAKHAEFMKGKKHSAERKTRVDYTKPCKCCGKLFNPAYEKKRLYCSQKCAGSNNKDPIKKQQLAEAATLNWQKRLESKKMKTVNDRHINF